MGGCDRSEYKGCLVLINYSTQNPAADSYVL